MSSKKNQRRANFFAEHPTCCFCGGDTPAVEEDHFPSRALFRDRQWPEGYVFPACKSCNEASRFDEQVIAFLVRIFPNIDSENGWEETNKLIKALVRNHKLLVDELWMSPTEMRKTLRSLDIKKPAHIATSDIPLVSAKGALLNVAVQAFGRKLFLALYYMHTGEILPPLGGVSVRWYTNIQLAKNDITEDVRKLASRFPKLSRCSTSLHDQFFYQYAVSDDAMGAVFIASFRRSFKMVGFVFKDAKAFRSIDDEKIWSPL